MIAEVIATLVVAMAPPLKLDLFSKQAKEYARFRPRYPRELYNFLASLTAGRSLAWDVGTGNGQAAVELAKDFATVVATDISAQQLSFAIPQPRVRYAVTSSVMAWQEIEQIVGPKNSVDLVTVAQALHWFEFETFYANVKNVLKRPGGVFAAWTYGLPRISPEIDGVVDSLYKVSEPYWEARRKYVDECYQTIPFDFRAIPGREDLGTGPVNFEGTTEMSLEEFVGFLRSWSATNTALENGVNLLDSHFLSAIRQAWGKESDQFKLVKWPIFLRLGTC